MRMVMTVSLAFVLLVLPAGVSAVDEVDIGLEASEAGHNLQGWGPIQPQTSGGGYGKVHDCRAVYAPIEYENGRPCAPGRWATLDLDFGQGNPTLMLRHLDGLVVNDAFEVYIYPPGHPEAANLVWTYSGDGLTLEIWYESEISVDATGINTVRLVSTDVEWPGWQKYGQVCFDRVGVSWQPLSSKATTWGAIKSLYR